MQLGDVHEPVDIASIVLKLFGLRDVEAGPSSNERLFITLDSRVGRIPRPRRRRGGSAHEILVAGSALGVRHRGTVRHHLRVGDGPTVRPACGRAPCGSRAAVASSARR